MNRLGKILQELNNLECGTDNSSSLYHTDTRVKLITTLLFLILMLSVPIYNLAHLILFVSYPIITCSLTGIKYFTIAKRSLVVLPFVLFIGLFNPILDTRPMYIIANFHISAGWISFFSIILRGIIATQAVLVLIYSSGFQRICNALRQLGVPNLLVTQLLLVYRYTFVLLQETMSMHRARLSRSFGKGSYKMKTWGVFVGQLFLRTTIHSTKIYQAMLARGFSGKIIVHNTSRWTIKDTLYLIIMSTGLICLKFINFNTIS